MSGSLEWRAYTAHLRYTNRADVSTEQIESARFRADRGRRCEVLYCLINMVAATCGGAMQSSSIRTCGDILHVSAASQSRLDKAMHLEEVGIAQHFRKVR